MVLLVVVAVVMMIISLVVPQWLNIYK